MKFLNQDTVLCLSAHPDDVEYGMLGTFEKCNNTKFIIIIMSPGGDFDNTTTQTNRVNESKTVWKCFNNVTGHVNNKLNFIKNQLEDEMIHSIETIYKDSISCIAIPPKIDSHFEHRMINNVGIALCRKYPTTIIEYRTPSTLNEWNPNYFINLNKTQYNKKKKMLRKFKSQQKATYFNKNTIDSFHHNFLCIKKGLNIVESYRIIEGFQLWK